MVLLALCVSKKGFYELIPSLTVVSISLVATELMRALQMGGAYRTCSLVKPDLLPLSMVSSRPSSCAVSFDVRSREHEEHDPD
jgi:hypothetical protein